MVSDATRRRRARARYELDRPAGLVQPCLACSTYDRVSALRMGYCSGCWKPAGGSVAVECGPERLSSDDDESS